jgi:hypothetical protein
MAVEGATITNSCFRVYIYIYIYIYIFVCVIMRKLILI